MPDQDRKHLKELVEKTQDEGLRGVLMMLLTLIERQDEDRNALHDHQRREEEMLKKIAEDPETHHLEHVYVARMMQAQAKALEDREALRRAIIEKSFSGLVWVGLVYVGKAMFNYFSTHGWR